MNIIEAFVLGRVLGRLECGWWNQAFDTAEDFPMLKQFMVENSAHINDFNSSKLSQLIVQQFSDQIV